MSSAASSSKNGPPHGPGGDITGFTRRLVAGEDAAWTEFHHCYAGRLWRYLLVAAQGAEDLAAEALQQTFVRAVRYARRFETEEALWGWLTLMARQVLAGQRRSRSRWQDFLHRLTGQESGRMAGSSPDDPWPEMLEMAWPELTGEDRTLLDQKYLEGRSIRELASTAGISEKAVESRLTRARQRLRERILHHFRLP